MEIREIIKKQDRKYGKKYRPVKTGAVRGYTRGQWLRRKYGMDNKNGNPSGSSQTDSFSMAS